MDFNLTEEQLEIARLSRQIIGDRTHPDHLSEIEASGRRYDPALWQDLAAADLLGLALPESAGGSGRGFLELGLLLQEVGWSVAPVPIYATLLLGANAIASFGSPEQQLRHLPPVISGSRLLTGALCEPDRSAGAHPTTVAKRDGGQWRLDGAKELVPAGQLADAMVVPALADDGVAALFIIDVAAKGVDVRPVATTNGEPYADVLLDGAVVDEADRLGSDTPRPDVLGRYLEQALVGLSLMQLGVADRALRIAASYTSEREQFGRPIGSFQAVQQRLADAFIDVEAIRWTAWYAAWLLAEDRPASREARIAKFWAAEAGARVTASAQQVHGGMGIDTSYPLFRYFLWSKQIELALGSAPQQLSHLGASFAEETQ